MKFAKYLVLSVFLSSPAFAYLSVTESAEVMKSGTYALGIEPQFLTSDGGGTNINAFVDAGFRDDLSGRISVGGGETDFNAFASAKWVPFPDYDNQPAMGVRFGAGFARDEELNILQIQMAPMVSKKIDTVYGLATPYLAIPFTYLNTKHDNTVASNFVIGSEFNYFELPTLKVGAELGLELNDSYSYISLYISFPFDSGSGFGN